VVFSCFASGTLGEDLFFISPEPYELPWNLSERIRQDFGPDARLADWEEIKDAFSEDARSWADEVGIKYFEWLFVSRKGEQRAQGNDRYAYFLQRRKGAGPRDRDVGILDQIDSHELILILTPRISSARALVCLPRESESLALEVLQPKLEISVEPKSMHLQIGQSGSWTVEIRNAGCFGILWSDVEVSFQLSETDGLLSWMDGMPFSEVEETTLLPPRAILEKTVSLAAIREGSCFIDMDLIFVDRALPVDRTEWMVLRPEGDETTTRDGTEHVCRLSFDPRTGYMFAGSSFRGMDVVFRKEPEYEGQKIIRGALFNKGAKSPDFVGFAWDAKGGKLYVDLNQDLDLTNDPGSPFAAPMRNGRCHASVNLEVIRDEIPLSYCVDFYLNYGGHWNAVVRSGWTGRVSLHGRDYRLCVMDDINGMQTDQDEISVTPWMDEPGEPRSNPLYLSSSQHFYHQGRRYAITFSFEPHEKTGAVLARLTEVPVDLAWLDIEQEGVSQLDLWSGPVVVRLEDPGAREQVPVGTYTRLETVLEQGINGALDLNLRVTSDVSSTLRLGRPVKPRVDMYIDGPFLTLSFAMEGVGGEKYESPDRWRWPQFRIYKGNKPIVSGDFEYG